MLNSRTFLLTIIFGLLTVTSGLSQDGDAKTKKAVEARQHEYFDLVIKKDFASLDAMLAADYIGTYRLGIIDRTKESADLRQFPLASYDMSDVKFAVLDKKTVVIAFHLHVKVVVDGKEFFEDDNLSCTWIRRKGKWILAAQAAVKVM